LYAPAPQKNGTLPAAVFFAASFDIRRSTSSSPLVSVRSNAESGTTADFGTSRNNASIFGAPIFLSIAVRSSAVSGW
jgi:hypothetical protein